MSAFPVLSFLAFLATRRTEVDPEYEHIYTTLTTFVSRGQTVVEDIPPLSLLVGSHNSAESLQLFAVAVEYLRLLVWTSLTYCHVVSVQKRRMMYGLMVIAFLVPVLLFDSGHEHLSPAQTAATLGELFYTIALATTMIGRDKAQSNGLTRTICLDSMLAISFLLGCQNSNWIITMILHQNWEIRFVCTTDWEKQDIADISRYGSLVAPSLEFCFGSPFLWLWSLLSSALLIRFPSELLEETGTYATFLQRLDGFCVASLNHKLSSLTTQSQAMQLCQTHQKASTYKEPVFSTQTTGPGTTQ
ncbi:hypothetical protein D6C76_08815 [Aureobasidium pullulans]|nr:hypothetical protein D6C76_08815 [Aureobasidium pullulans]